MVAKIKIHRTITPNTPPAGLAEGELAIELGVPTRLWVGCAIAQDPSGRKLLTPSVPVIVSDTPPVLPRPGDLWFESDTLIFWIRYDDGNSQQWLQLNGGSSDGGSGGLDQSMADTLYVNIPGDTMTGHLTLSADPVNPLHAVTKQYADAAFVNVSGDTMTNFLTLHANPVNPLHAATKQYADAAGGGIKGCRMYGFATSNTYYKAADAKIIEVTIIGPGGGTSNCAGTGAGQSACSSGGGGGGATIRTFLASALTAATAITVAAAGSQPGGIGSGGGTSYFGGVYATGGTAGHGGGAFGGPGYTQQGGQGGAGGGGDLNFHGGDGTAGIYNFGGAGTCAAGTGGSSYGSGQVVGPHANVGQAYNANGGYNPGGGASGAASGDNIGFATVGGTGGPSYILVKEFY